MHELPEADSTDTGGGPDESPVELDENGRTPEEDLWFRDHCYARYALQDGDFEKYRGYVVAVYQKQVVGKGKNPKHLRFRIAKKLGIDPLQMILVDLDYGIL